MKKLLLGLTLLFFGLSMASCTQAKYDHNIFATVYPVKYVIEELFKDTDLTVGIVPGVSSHNEAVDWSPKEIIAMGNAEYLFYVGANYDTYIDNQIGQIFTNKNVELVKIENNLVNYIPGIVHNHENHDHENELASDALGYDPHFWISPKRMITLTENVYPLLLAKYPDYESTFATNYDTLMANLSTINLAFTNAISKTNKTIMTSTNLYSYLHEDYGLEFIPISPGYHEEAEQFTSAQKQTIVDEAILHHITHIVFERDSSSPLSNAVLSTLNSLDYNVVKLEFIIMDSLRHEDIQNKETYLTLMDKNLTVIHTATNQLGD